MTGRRQNRSGRTCINGGESRMTAPATSGRFALLSDGRTVEIRHATPEDVDDVRRMHEELSPDNSYFRFFSFSPKAPEREAVRVCRPEGADHAALLAWLAGELVGVASYEPTTRPGVAEIAFAVSDEMHGHGIATLLLEHLVSLARQRHLSAFSAETLPENMAMQRVFADAGLHGRAALRRWRYRAADAAAQGTRARNSISYLDAVAGRASRADVASLQHLLRASLGRGHRRRPAPRIGRPGDPAQHRLRRLHRSGLSGESARALDGGPGLPGIRRRPAGGRRPRGHRGAARAGTGGGRGVRQARRALARRDHREPGRRRRGPAGNLPPVRDAPGRPELLRPRVARP